MSKTLLLHIGDPKTGTSSVQEVLLNRLYQADTVSVDYPQQLNSFPLANCLWDPKQLAERNARWTRMARWVQASDADLAVISAEQFFRVKPADLQAALNEFLPEHAASARVLAYVRPHASRLLSAFMQRTKAGLFHGDMATFFERSKRESLLTYAPRFQSWQAAFGDRFTLRPMIRASLKDGDVVADFLDQALQGQPFALQGTVQANISLPLQSLVGIRVVQTVLRTNEVAGGTRHSVGDHLNRSLSQLGVTGTKLQLPRALYDSVRSYCAEDAAALDDGFFVAPLMARALDDAEADVTAQPQDLRGESHFAPATLNRLRRKARRLAGLFQKNPTAWTIAFEREIGQRPAAPVPPALQGHITTVDTLLTEIAQLLTTPLSGDPT